MFSSFRGGIHPRENKQITEELPFTNFSIPHSCSIPLQQHIGAPAKPVVEQGEYVKEGQLIGEADGLVSANVHSSIPGKVQDIAEVPTIYGAQKSVIIEAEGEFTSTSDRGHRGDWKTLSRDDMLQGIQDAGIVGLGGAAFPTAVKLSPPPDKKIETLVVNGAECEPYLTVDDMLMQTCPVEIIEGIEMTMKILGVETAVIGIEDNKKHAVSSLRQALKNSGMEGAVSVKSLPTKYPQGAEKQLIYSLTRKKVPSGGLPMDVGIVVQNVGTIFALREAVLFEKPLFERYITVSGSLINKPGNYKVRIGTTIRDIIEECGGLKGDPAKIIIGGPMCGISVFSLEVPVVKGTSGILFFSEEEINVEDYSPCIRCGKCVTACPVGMLPSDIGNAVEMDRLDLVEDLNPYDCIMCGTCSYICPANRPLSHFIKLAQGRLKKK